MIGPDEFARRLLPWIDGQLPPHEAEEMRAYCVAHPEARARADAERALERRVRDALLAGADGRRLVADAIRAARTGDAAESVLPPPRPRVLRGLRWGSAAAAALVAAVGGMWWFCVPPFECAVVQALEAAADEPALGTDEVDGLLRERVALVCDANGCAWRTVVDVAGSPAVLLRTAAGERPSVRRRHVVGGRAWWIGREGGRTVVAFEEPGTAGLWCFVGTQDEATLLGAANLFRDERERVAAK